VHTAHYPDHGRIYNPSATRARFNKRDAYTLHSGDGRFLLFLKKNPYQKFWVAQNQDRSIGGIIFVQLGEMEEGLSGHSARSYTNICR
jgi:hypothetical protein